MAITIPIITDFNSRGIDSATRQFQKLETTGKKAGFAVRKAALPAGIALVALAAGAIDAVSGEGGSLVPGARYCVAGCCGL